MSQPNEPSTKNAVLIATASKQRRRNTTGGRIQFVVHSVTRANGPPTSPTNDAVDIWRTSGGYPIMDANERRLQDTDFCHRLQRNDWPLTRDGGEFVTPRCKAREQYVFKKGTRRIERKNSKNLTELDGAVQNITGRSGRRATNIGTQTL